MCVCALPDDNGSDCDVDIFSFVYIGDIIKLLSGLMIINNDDHDNDSALEWTTSK